MSLINFLTFFIGIVHLQQVGRVDKVEDGDLLEILWKKAQQRSEGWFHIGEAAICGEACCKAVLFRHKERLRIHMIDPSQGQANVFGHGKLKVAAILREKEKVELTQEKIRFNWYVDTLQCYLTCDSL